MIFVVLPVAVHWMADWDVLRMRPDDVLEWRLKRWLKRWRIERWWFERRRQFQRWRQHEWLGLKAGPISLTLVMLGAGFA